MHFLQPAVCTMTQHLEVEVTFDQARWAGGPSAERASGTNRWVGDRRVDQLMNRLSPETSRRDVTRRCTSSPTCFVFAARTEAHVG